MKPEFEYCVTMLKLEDTLFPATDQLIATLDKNDIPYMTDKFRTKVRITDCSLVANDKQEAVLRKLNIPYSVWYDKFTAVEGPDGRLLRI
jgi:hypothetical protein